MDDLPYTPPQPEPDDVSNRAPETSHLQTVLGCGSLLLLMCLPLAMLGWYERSHRDWIQQLDTKAKKFGGDVYNGRRDAASHLMISCHEPRTSDLDVPQIVSLGAECLAGGATKLHIDLSKTRISDDSIDRFAMLLRLNTLDLSDTLVSPSGAARLRIKMPVTDILDKHNFP